MTAACLHPLPLYRPRDPQASGLWRLMDRHFETFQRLYDERFQAKYGYWRPIVERSVTAYLCCGDLDEGFARVRCGDCGHEMFVGRGNGEWYNFGGWLGKRGPHLFHAC